MVVLRNHFKGRGRMKWKEEASFEGLLVKGKKEIKDSTETKKDDSQEDRPIPFQQLPAKMFAE